MENIGKKDLDELKFSLILEIEKLLEKMCNSGTKSVDNSEWLKSKAVRKIMEISPATLQNLRIKGKIKFKKIMGSYYYNKIDLKKLFEDE